MTDTRITGWILVTGAAGHLGKKIVSEVVACGGKVFATDLLQRAPELEHLQASFGDSTFRFLPGDLSSLDFLIELINEVSAQASPLLGLVNNAAYVGTNKTLQWESEFGRDYVNAWSEALKLNLTVPMVLSQGLSGTFERGSSIVNIGSVYGVVAPSWSLYEGTAMVNPAAYGVSKAGLIHLSRWLSSKLAPKTRVNSLSPGGIARDGQSSIFIDRYAEMTHMKELATEEDIVKAVMFLLSSQSSYITGANLMVDGGFSAS